MNKISNLGLKKTESNSNLIKFELLLTITLQYGVFILILPILALFFNAKKQSLSLYSFLETITEPVLLYACTATFLTAFWATIINAIVGLILGWVLVRYEFPGKNILDTAVDLPFALPTSVGGLTLMTVYSSQGWMGPLCNWLHIKVAFTRLGVLMAMIFVSLPFVVRTIQPVLQSLEKEVEEAAWCTGASPWATFWCILFPSLMPSVLTGTALGFSRAIGEYGSIVLIGANIPMKDLVISVLIFQKLEQYDYKGATAIAIMTLIVSFTILFVINYIQFWRHTFTR